MKKLILILFFISCGMQAQHDKSERIKAVKIAYITEQLDLSSSEAEKFWPIYNAHEDEMHSLRKNERAEMHQKTIEGIDEMTDAEANQLLDQLLDYKTKELTQDQELLTNLRKVLAPQKILKLKKIEKDFRKKLLERYKHRKKSGN